MPAILPIFRRVSVSIDPSGYPTLYWDLRVGFQPASGTALFYIDVCSSPGEAWTRLNPDDPVVDDYLWQDTVVRRVRIVPEVYYRVVLEDGTDVYASQTVNLTGQFADANMFRLACAIVNEEWVRLSKTGAGTPGWLLKRRHWGTRCPVCRDYAMDVAIQPDCPSCFGTGILGGFFKAYEYYISFDEVVSDSENTQIGQEEHLMKSGRCLAFPLLEANDLWVSRTANDRYLVQSQISHAAELAGVALVYKAKFELVMPGDIEYEAPILLI